MLNAKNELLALLKDSHLRIKCAHVSTYDLGWTYEWRWKQDESERRKDDKDIKLMVGYNEEEFKKFLSELDFEYDDGYGSQKLYGIIWFEDGTWAERGEYDGSEWWAVRKLPAVPNELIQVRS